MLEDKAALLTLSLAIASLLSGAVSGIFLETFYNVGFATALTTFVEKASRTTAVVPNVPEQVAAASTAIQQAVTNQAAEKPKPVFLMMGIALSNLRPLLLIPAIHAVMPFGMLLEGRGRLKNLGTRHESFIMASALTPLAINGYTIGGSISEYPVITYLLVLELLPLALVSYIAAKAFLTPFRGLERLKTAYTGCLGIFTASLMITLAAASMETWLVGEFYD
ncbi:MAG: hypothetical protein QW362_06360 [Candidatus Caldarchaeum sp.]